SAAPGAPPPLTLPVVGVAAEDTGKPTYDEVYLSNGKGVKGRPLANSANGARFGSRFAPVARNVSDNTAQCYFRNGRAVCNVRVNTTCPGAARWLISSRSTTARPARRLRKGSPASSR